MDQRLFGICASEPAGPEPLCLSQLQRYQWVIKANPAALVTQARGSEARPR